jgi:hypothetical protein
MKRERGGFRMLQREQLLQSGAGDSYRGSRKPGASVVCPDCRAVFRRGRWRTGAAPRSPLLERCPACRRLREHLPAGYVTLSGEFLAGHRGEILQRLRHCEAAERARHPLERIMAIEETPRGTLVTTTGTHLARRIGAALRDAYKGQLALRYSREENLLRVSWRR